MEQLREMIARVARTRLRCTSTAIGTGKEFGKHGWSNDAAAPEGPIYCRQLGAIPTELMESRAVATQTRSFNRALWLTSADSLQSAEGAHCF